MAAIIVEGPDGAGKSTLVGKLAKMFGARVIHHGPYLGERSIAGHYRRSLFRALLDPRPIILDRAWQSEPIYGAAARRGAVRVSVHERRALERLAHRCDAVLVVCLPPRDVCERSWRARRGDEYLSRADQLNAVYTGYEQLAAAPPWEQSLPVTTYDYTNDSVKDLMYTVTNLGGSSPSVAKVPGLGRFRPGGTLIVGAEMGAPRRLDLPFIDATRRGCSAWLSDRLHEWAVPESSLYWVNAYFDGAATPFHWLDRLQPRRVVALGNVARLRLIEVNTRFQTVPHPQFWRRFKRSEEYPLRRHLS